MKAISLTHNAPKNAKQTTATLKVISAVHGNGNRIKKMEASSDEKCLHFLIGRLLFIHLHLSARPRARQSTCSEHRWARVRNWRTWW